MSQLPLSTHYNRYPVLTNRLEATKQSQVPKSNQEAEVINLHQALCFKYL